MKRMKRTKKILSILICLSLLFTYVPVGLAAEEAPPLPQTPAEYAASDYAKYAGRMAVGDQHIAVVKPDGTVAVWGNDTYDGNQLNTLDVPAELKDVKVKTVAAGTHHTIALTEDGRVFAWGSVYDKDWNIQPVTIPDEVNNLQGNIRLIAAGSSMSAVVANDGRIVIWGQGADTFSEIPEGLISNNNVVALRIGGNYAVALNDQGGITVWGQPSEVPDALTGKTVVDVAVGIYHWLALTNEGKVVAVGNHADNLSDINNQENVRAIAGGWQFAGALLVDGSVMGWGRTPTGNTWSNGIQQIAADENIKAFSSVIVPEKNSRQTICAMRDDGTLIVKTSIADALQTQIPEGLNLITTTSSSSNADLSSLSVTGYDLDKTFDAATDTYTVNVPNDVSSVNITATTADTTATLKINGAAVTSGIAQTVDNLAVGDNPVAVEVTAEDGTVKTYTLTIKRAEAAQGNNADLSDLTVAGYSLDKTFDAATYTYTVNVPNDVSSVEITVTTADSNATLKISGTAASSGSAQTVENLIVGNNPVPMEVTAADGITVKTYTLTIKRAGEGGFPQTPAEYAASDYARLAARLAAGSSHAAAVLSDGTVEVWGSNDSHQLEVTAAAAGVKALAAGSLYTLALKEDGALVGWGANSFGQCDPPAELAGTTVKAVSAWWASSAALTEDNRIVIWGRYGSGQDAGVKTVKSEKPLVDIAINSSYLLALAADGTVAAWEWRYKDGIGFLYDCLPRAVPDGFSGDVVAITSGENHALALKADGSVVSWDNDSYPVPADLANVRAVVAGSGYSAALTADGGVVVWGKDKYGLLDVPSGLAQVCALSAGSTNIYALREDGTVVSWGRNSAGEGDVPEYLNLNSPVSSNNRLIGLNVETKDGAACGIYPKFNCTQTEGIVDVAYDTEEVRITAQPYSSAATLQINGAPATAGIASVVYGSSLAVGANPIEIKVTAADGRERTYTLHVKKVSADCALPQTPAAYQASQYAAYARCLAAGSEHSLVLKKDGTVAAWGGNREGQCNVPAGLDGVAALAAGGRHSLALKIDGTVVAWGSNSSGQSEVPAGLGEVVDVSAGGNSSAGLNKNGTVTVWGDNGKGQCDVPAGLSNVADIQCGTGFVLALKADGTVVAWGDNGSGQCDVPAGLSGVVAVAAGGKHSMALKADGTLVTWGQTYNGIRQGDVYGHPSLQYVKAITSGNYFTAALKWDGSLAVWGNYYGNNVDMGVPLELDQEVLAVSGNSSGVHLLALNGDGTVTAWGDPLDYQNGNFQGQCDVPQGLNLIEEEPPYSGAAPDIPRTPAEYAASEYVRAVDKICNVFTGTAVLNMDGTVKVIITGRDDYNLAKVPEGLSNVKSLATSFHNVMALKEDGTVVVWGYDGDGQCQVPEGVKDVIAIAANNWNTYCLALKRDGTVAAWGGNYAGQCGVPAGLSNVTAIAAGDTYCLALKADGTVTAWGNNDYGQCDVPEGLNNVNRIYACSNFSMALKNDGTVVAWGNNNKGQCDVPEGLSEVVHIYVSGATCIALKSNGTVVVWGDNSNGCRNVPVGLHDVVAINSGGGGINAIKADGSVVVWGNLASFDDEILTRLSSVLTIARDVVIFQDGSLQYFPDVSYKDDVNKALAGLNVLSGHYFAINKAELLNPAGQSINTVASQGGYRIKASVSNNNGRTTPGLAIIQVRGGSGAAGAGGGRVLGCVGISGDIPVTGSTVSSDFTMPLGISGTAYVDVFVWDGWGTMVPRAEASQNLSFSVTN